MIPWQAFTPSTISSHKSFKKFSISLKIDAFTDHATQIMNQKYLAIHVLIGNANNYFGMLHIRNECFKVFISNVSSKQLLFEVKSLLVNKLHELKTNFFSTWAILNLKYYQSLELTRKHLFTYIRLDAFTTIYKRRHNKVIVFWQRKRLHNSKKWIKCFVQA